MPDPFALSDINHYEQACDQAIAMCNGNMRSTIKALIMANEYLEAELLQLQVALDAGVIEKLPNAGIVEGRNNAA
jgi:hypothetical protein